MDKSEHIHCNKCRQKTNHRAVSLSHERKGAESFDEGDCYFEIQWTETNTLFECCGCGNITFKRQVWCSEWEQDEIEFYPPLISRPLPSWYSQLPPDMCILMKEIYTAMHADNRRLALIGLRTLVDDYMNDKVGDVGTFQKKLNELEAKKVLSESQRGILESALDAGHAAVHRGFCPIRETVEDAMDIVENLLQTYALEQSARKLKKVIPPKRKI